MCVILHVRYSDHRLLGSSGPVPAHARTSIPSWSYKVVPHPAFSLISQDPSMSRILVPCGIVFSCMIVRGGSASICVPVGGSSHLARPLIEATIVFFPWKIPSFRAFHISHNRLHSEVIRLLSIPDVRSSKACVKSKGIRSTLSAKDEEN